MSQRVGGQRRYTGRKEGTYRYPCLDPHHIHLCVIVCVSMTGEDASAEEENGSVDDTHQSSLYLPVRRYQSQPVVSVIELTSNHSFLCVCVCVCVCVCPA